MPADISGNNQKETIHILATRVLWRTSEKKYLRPPDKEKWRRRIREHKKTRPKERLESKYSVNFLSFFLQNRKVGDCGSGLAGCPYWRLVWFALLQAPQWEDFYGARYTPSGRPGQTGSNRWLRRSWRSEGKEGTGASPHLFDARRGLKTEHCLHCLGTGWLHLHSQRHPHTSLNLMQMQSIYRNGACKKDLRDDRKDR